MKDIKRNTGENVLQIAHNNKAFILVFDELTDDIKSKIDSEFIRLREGINQDTHNELSVLKSIFYDKCLKKGNNKKTNYTKRRAGFIGELLSHIFLVDKNNGMEKLEPVFLFDNLEKSSSYKNGFDGVYLSKKNDLWILEVKAAYRENSHYKKLAKAYEDITGPKKNNPWKEAFFHANNPVNASDDIKKKLKILADVFDHPKEPNEDLKKHSIILSSPIFINPQPTTHTHNEIEFAIEKCTNYEANNLRLIAMSVPFLDKVVDFFKGGGQ